MFGLFKKKKQQTEALIEKDEHTGSDNGAADIAARTASNQATQIQMQKAAQTFAKPSQYTGNRNLFDSGAAKRNAKMQAFANGQKPIDPYTGAELELTKKAAKAKYGADWTKHLAETDHAFSLEEIFNQKINCLQRRIMCKNLYAESAGINHIPFSLERYERKSCLAKKALCLQEAKHRQAHFRNSKVSKK